MAADRVSCPAVRFDRLARAANGGEFPVRAARRAWLGGAVVAAVLFFSVMFSIKNNHGFDNDLLVKQVYVASEYILAILCLGYAPVGYFDAKPWFEKFRSMGYIGEPNRAPDHFGNSAPESTREGML